VDERPSAGECHRAMLQGWGVDGSTVEPRQSKPTHIPSGTQPSTHTYPATASSCHTQGDKRANPPRQGVIPYPVGTNNSIASSSSPVLGPAALLLTAARHMCMQQAPGLSEARERCRYRVCANSATVHSVCDMSGENASTPIVVFEVCCTTKVLLARRTGRVTAD
jgi:hypothetical protein